MGRLSYLAEVILTAVGTPEVLQSAAYRAALRFLREGVLPDGRGWRDGPPPLVVTLGDAEACAAVRVRQSALPEGGTRFDARFAVQPSRGGGAGVSIDGVATAAFLAQQAPATDSTRIEFGAALRAVAEERTGAIQRAFEQALAPDLVWRLVGWPQRDAWALTEAPIVERLALGHAQVDHVRGETWAAQHWEAWVPATLDVVARLRRG